ncbi:MAG TPA: Asp-tRNA(Asn)/Glu-tRNA(Gln) amidotransferase GatCAB subunit C [Erysipelotrichaceae bacterium]|nr:Asp-tRNA(Asn)/Glu-tRNA(Gln) amidotransferase GatCAB subunit C [Erysipelotrichaceae bacterium]
MKRLDVQGFKDLANQLRFSLSDEEANDIKNEFDVLIDQMDLLNKIDTEGVEPMVYPFDEETSFLREDVAIQVLPVQEVLKNAPKEKNGFFVTQKVVG